MMDRAHSLLFIFERKHKEVFRNVYLPFLFQAEDDKLRTVKIVFMTKYESILSIFYFQAPGPQSSSTWRPSGFRAGGAALRDRAVLLLLVTQAAPAHASRLSSLSAATGGGSAATRSHSFIVIGQPRGGVTGDTDLGQRGGGGRRAPVSEERVPDRVRGEAGGQVQGGVAPALQRVVPLVEEVPGSSQHHVSQPLGRLEGISKSQLTGMALKSGQMNLGTLDTQENLSHSLRGEIDPDLGGDIHGLGRGHGRRRGDWSQRERLSIARLGALNRARFATIAAHYYYLFTMGWRRVRAKLMNGKRFAWGFIQKEMLEAKVCGHFSQPQDGDSPYLPPHITGDTPPPPSPLSEPSPGTYGDKSRVCKQMSTNSCQSAKRKGFERKLSCDMTKYLFVLYILELADILERLIIFSLALGLTHTELNFSPMPSQSDSVI